MDQNKHAGWWLTQSAAAWLHVVTPHRPRHPQPRRPPLRDVRATMPTSEAPPRRSPHTPRQRRRGHAQQPAHRLCGLQPQGEVRPV